MARFGRGKALTASAEPQEPRKSLVASAIRTNLSDLSYNLWKFRDEGWQRELWRYYDIIPEFRFAAGWVGQCCSRVRVFVANVDKLGRIQDEVVEPSINALADTLLGGPASKQEALRSLGINLTVAGECYIVGKPGVSGSDALDQVDTLQDQWYVLSATEMRRVQSANGEWQWAWYLPDGNPFQLDLEHNVITRVWTPHPARVWCADSPSRSCQPILRELEQLTKYVFSQIDSRLIGAGILVIPNNLDLPQEEGTNNASESLMIRLATAGAASLRGEGTALGVLPHIIEADNPEGFKLLTFESALSQQAQQLRQEAVNRLGAGMDMPLEALTGMGEANHWCLSVDTSILTENKGWVTYDQVVPGDLVMTLNHETGESEWQPAQAVNVFEVEDEPMLSLESRTHSSLSTANHKWPVVDSRRGVPKRKWKLSQDRFTNNQGIPVAAKQAALRTDVKYSDSFVKLVAAYTSDGTLQATGWAHLTKFQPQEIAETRRVISEVFSTDMWSETVEHTSATYPDATRFHFKPAATEALTDVAPGRVKAVTRDFIYSLTESQLLLFLNAMLEIGDGTRRGEAYIFFQAERERLEAVELAAILLGMSVTWSTRDKHSDGAFNKGPLYVLHVSHRQATYPAYADPTWIKYTGKVWCPTTANRTWLAKRNGKVFYTGNSSYLIDGSGIKIHIEPLMNRICDALTKAYLAPALKLMGKDPSRYTYAYDTSPLTLRPQRLQDALNLYDHGAIGFETLRREGYFKESDKPTVEEDAKRYLRDLLLRDPQLIQNAAVRKAIGIPETVLPQKAMIAPTPDALAMKPGGPPLGPGDQQIMGPSGPPPPPAPPTGIQSQLPPPMPNTLNDATSGAPPTGILASAFGASGVSQRQVEEMGVVVVAEAAIRRGLELAGKRLLSKEHRSRWTDIPAFELHTKIKVEDLAHANRLLLGAWDQLNVMTQFVAQDFDCAHLQRVLHKYCTRLLLTSEVHNSQNLPAYLRTEGVLSAI